MEEAHKESLKLELNSVREELLSTRKELTEVRHKHMGCGQLIESLKTEVANLQKERSAKTSEIYKLQRENTVQIWQKEKDRFLGESKHRIEELEKSVKTLHSEKSALQERIKVYEEKFKTEKLRNEKMKNEVGFAHLDAESIKDQKQQEQRMFLLEQDMLRLQSELNKWHKSSLGLLHGICIDYETCFVSILHNSMKEDVTIDRKTARQARWLHSVMTRCRDHARSGTIGNLQAELPEYYIALDTDILKVKSAAPKSARLQATLDHKTSEPSPDLNSTGGSHVTEDQHNDNGDASSSDGSNSDRTDGITERRKANPTLVDPKSGLPNQITILKHFPHFTTELVMQNYDNFKSYDQDDDNFLDLIEMATAMNSTVGDQFTTAQLQDVLNEVDNDGNGVLDFYEYLQVVDMLMHKKGHSAVFRSKFVKDYGHSISDTCSVM